MKPEISVIIPAYNEEEYIGPLLDNLLAQKIPVEYEILVIDGESKDKTQEIVNTYKKKAAKIKLHTNKKRRTPHALNIGIKKAKGKYITFIGAHTLIPNNWLKKNYETITKAKEEVAAVGGKLIPTKSKNEFIKATEYVTSTYIGGGVSAHRYSNKKRYVDTVVFAMYKKDILKKNMIDEEYIYGQDLEVNIRLIKQGYKLLFNPAIQSRYYTRDSARKFTRQMWNYGVSRMKIMQKNKYIKLANIIPIGFGLYIIAMIPLSILLHAIFIIPFIAFLLAITTYSLGRKQTFLKNILAYLIIYFAFSLGMLAQIIRKNRNNWIT